MLLLIPNFKFDMAEEFENIENVRDEFRQFLAELLQNFEQLQSQNLFTGDLEVADSMLTLASKSCSGICFFIRVFQSNEFEVHHEILAALHQLLEMYNTLVSRYSDRLSSIEENENNSFSCTQEQIACRGRPRFVVSKPQIEGLQELGFSWSKIATMIGVSRTTLYRRRSELGIDKGEAFNQMEDHELDQIIASIIQLSPNSGEVMVRGALRARQIKIQRWRIRSSLIRVDPERSRRRQRLRIERRVYRVPGPNSLW